MLQSAADFLIQCLPVASIPLLIGGSPKGRMRNAGRKPKACTISQTSTQSIPSFCHCEAQRAVAIRSSNCAIIVPNRKLKILSLFSRIYLTHLVPKQTIYRQIPKMPNISHLFAFFLSRFSLTCPVGNAFMRSGTDQSVPYHRGNPSLPVQYPLLWSVAERSEASSLNACRWQAYHT